VWQNGGADVRYRVSIDDAKFEVPAVNAGAPYVSFDLHDIAPGTHRLQIEVLDASGAVKYSDEKGGELIWLSADDSRALKTKYEGMLQDTKNTDEDIAEFLASNGLLVAAMDHCRQSLSETPDDEAVKLAYFKLLTQLRLDVLKSKLAAQPKPDVAAH
jgi:hypothetical protein